MTGHYKDTILDHLARRANIAQFVSFSPGDEPRLRFAHVGSNARSEAVEEAVSALLEVVGSVNVRSFDPYQPRSHEFLYGLTDSASVVAHVRRLAGEGLHTIVNETIDVHDGGVSGVAYGDVIEFAPDDTPRAVEAPGTASVPRTIALDMLARVYGFAPALEYGPEVRVEFSIHPLRRGIRHEHTIVWEIEGALTPPPAREVIWPNRFSRFLGDKVFGLLLADTVGLPVPRTRVISRRVAPFEFGRATGTAEYWIRTAPVEQVPGRFTTRRGWIDPFELLADEDPEGLLPSVLAQEGVDSAWSGAAAVSPDEVTIEGVAGTGEAFMQGRAAPQPLPPRIAAAVRETVDLATQLVGAVRLEWVHDGRQAWIVQMHRGSIPASGATIYPGEPSVEHRFPVSNGLEALRELVAQLRGTRHGVVLVGSVGVTSHFGDVLRRAGVPARIEADEAPTAARRSVQFS